MPSSIAAFAAELTRKAQAEVPAAQKKFAQDPRAFRRWCAELLQNFQGQLTAENFLQWGRENRDEIRRAIDDEAPAAMRELDRSLLEVGGALEQGYQTAEAKKRPPKPDWQRQPPTREELMSAHFGASDWSRQGDSAIFGARITERNSGRTRRALRR